MELSKFNLVLGSQSPRRKELLSWLNIPFKIVTADLDEISHERDPHKIAMDLASQKAHAVFAKGSGLISPFIISSDTIVVLDQKLYGKPKDETEARVFLSELSGRTHRVITGVSFLYAEKAVQGQKEHLFYDSTEVTFENITKELMDDYISTGDSLDKAGAYGIQGPSLAFISNINGSYSNVVGFPLDKVVKELTALLGPHFKNRFVLTR